MPAGMSVVAARMVIPILLCMEADCLLSLLLWNGPKAYRASILLSSQAVMSAVNDRSTWSMRM